jgi:hypothetical protein
MRAIGTRSVRFAPFVLCSAVLVLPALRGRADDAMTVQALPGGGSDISVGADGTAWMVGYDTSDKDRNLYRWAGADWEQIDGKGTRIAVDPQGNPWVVDGNGDVMHWENGSWAEKPGTGTDIAVGANGDVWMVGWYTDLLDTDRNPENRSVFHWTGSAWEEIDGGAVRIAVAPDGTPWVIDNDGRIRQRTAGAWVQVDGRALDIGIGADGSVWVTTLTDDWGEDGVLAKREGTNWVSLSRPSAAVTVDPSGMPWFAKGDGDMFRGEPYELRLAVPVLSEGKVELSFPTVSGATYVVRVWRDLALPWAELQRVVGDGNPVTVTDTPPAGLGASCYSVVQE